MKPSLSALFATAAISGLITYPYASDLSETSKTAAGAAAFSEEAPSSGVAHKPVSAYDAMLSRNETAQAGELVETMLTRLKKQLETAQAELVELEKDDMATDTDFNSVNTKITMYTTQIAEWTARQEKLSKRSAE